MSLVGFSWSWNWRAWAWGWGWALPVKENGAWAGPAEGDKWLCLGPLALMFEQS